MARSIAEWCELIHEEAVGKGFWSNPCSHTAVMALPDSMGWCPDCGAVRNAQGWLDPIERKNSRPRPEQYLLFISEIAEAFEEYRKPGQPDAYVVMGDDSKMAVSILGMGTDYPVTYEHEGVKQLLKPEGELVECADIMIRLLDDIGHTWGSDAFEAAMEWKFAYNKTRGFRHGGKKA